MYKNGNNCILYVFISRSTISNFTKNSSYTERTEKLSKSNIRRYLFNFYIFIKFTIYTATVEVKIFIHLKLTTYIFLHYLIHYLIKEQTLRKISVGKQFCEKNCVQTRTSEKERRKKKSNNVKLSRFNHDKLKRRLNHSSRRLTNWMFGLICPR